MKERRLAILLAVLLTTALAFAGCGVIGDPGAEPPAGEKTSQDQQTAPAEAGEDEGEEQEDQEEGGGPPEARGGPPEDRGGPPEDRGGPPEDRGGGAQEDY